MSLTQKQEAFCLAYLETGNASEAYRRSYDAGGMKPESVNRKAKELIDNGKITARLTELRRPAVDAAQVTLGSHLTTLAELRDGAKKNLDFKAAIAAEVKRGEASGFYVQRVESGKPGAFTEDEKQLEQELMRDLVKAGIGKVVPIKRTNKAA